MTGPESVRGFPIEPSAENTARARDFVFRMWCEREVERGFPVPKDLSFSCKFTSIFAAQVFGAEMQGNEDHQFCVLPDGEILDLNSDAADVVELAKQGDPWRHDPDFWLNPDHQESLESCQDRVDAWLRRFAAEIAAEEAPGMAGP